MNRACQGCNRSAAIEPSNNALVPWLTVFDNRKKIKCQYFALGYAMGWAAVPMLIPQVI
jgi:hypothetical protein